MLRLNEGTTGLKSRLGDCEARVDKEQRNSNQCLVFQGIKRDH